MTYTSNLANTICTTGTSTGCVYSVDVRAIVTISGPLEGVTVNCPWKRYSLNSTYININSPALDTDTSSVTCTATWTWDPTKASPTQFSGTLGEEDGTGSSSPGNSYHSFQSAADLAPLTPAFEFAAVSGSPRTFDFTDTSTTAPGLTINSEIYNDDAPAYVGAGSPLEYTFPADGTYAVTLEVGDTANRIAYATQDVVVVSSGGSPPTITVIESLHPHSDAGRFSLKVDGKTVKSAAADGGYGEVTAKAGSHVISQTIHTGALTNYAVELSCAINGKNDGAQAARSATLKLKTATAVVCTFTDAYTSTKHCDVPHLKSESDAAAKKALRKAHCKVGSVTKPKKKSKKPKRLVVGSTSPAAYSVAKAGTKVKLTLVRR